MPFCPKCGKKLADGQVCDCQAPASPSADDPILYNSDSYGVSDGRAASAAGSKSTIVVIAAAAAAVLVVALLLFLIFGSGGYMKPINTLVAEINKGEKADVVDISCAYSPGFVDKFLNTVLDVADELVGEIEDENDDLHDQFEEMNDEIGKWKLSFEVSSKSKLSKGDLEDFRDELGEYWDDDFEDIVDELKDMDSDDIEDLCDFLDISSKDAKKFLSAYTDYLKKFENIKVTAGYKVKGSFVLKDSHGKKIDSTNKVTLYILNINGDWTVYSSKDYDTFYFQKSDSDDYKYYRFITYYINDFFDDVIYSFGFLY